MFESLTERLNNVFKTLTGKGRLTADDVDEALRHVRIALLEADVHFKVVKEFISVVKERATEQAILKSLCVELLQIHIQSRQTNTKGNCGFS